MATSPRLAGLLGRAVALGTGGRAAPSTSTLGGAMRVGYRAVVGGWSPSVVGRCAAGSGSTGPPAHAMTTASNGSAVAAWATHGAGTARTTAPGGGGWGNAAARASGGGFAQGGFAAGALGGGVPAQARGYATRLAHKRLTSKRKSRHYYKGKGARSLGRMTSRNNFIRQPEKEPEFIFPNLEGFALKPYIEVKHRPKRAPTSPPVLQ